MPLRSYIRLLSEAIVLLSKAITRPRKAIEVVREAIAGPREAIALLSKTFGRLRKTITPPRKAIGPPREAIEPVRKAIAGPREAIALLSKTITPPRKAIGRLRKAIGRPREAIEVVRKAITPPRKAFEIFLTFFRQVPSPFPRSGKKDCPQCVLQCLQGLVQAAFVCCFDAFKEGTSVEVVKKLLVSCSFFQARKKEPKKVLCHLPIAIGTPPDGTAGRCRRSSLFTAMALAISVRHKSSFF